MEDKFMRKTGEKAPVGFYTCACCSDELQIYYQDSDEKKLPMCAKCGFTFWMKV